MLKRACPQRRFAPGHPRCKVPPGARGFREGGRDGDPLREFGCTAAWHVPSPPPRLPLLWLGKTADKSRVRLQRGARKIRPGALAPAPGLRSQGWKGSGEPPGEGLSGQPGPYILSAPWHISGGSSAGNAGPRRSLGLPAGLLRGSGALAEPALARMDPDSGQRDSNGCPALSLSVPPSLAFFF